MIRLNARGLTLIELLLATGILALIGTAAVGLITTGLNAQSQGNSRFELYHEGTMVMQRITDGVRRSTFIQIPNAHTPVRDILAFSGTTNEDNDFYFGDPLLPRIDEDPKKQMTDDDKAGIKGLDDDGDGQTDEGDMNDDDEDGQIDEDQLDGIDNDGDGNIDEDTGDDANAANMDDDADGSIDEGDSKDDDEDGAVNEDPLNEVVYWIPSGTTLREDHHYSGVNRTLSEHAAAFQVTYESPQRILIELTLTSDDGESVTFAEYACPRNRLQKTGKRVR